MSIDPKRDDVFKRDDDGKIIAVKLTHDDGTPVTMADARAASTAAEWSQFERFADIVAREEDDEE